MDKKQEAEYYDEGYKDARYFYGLLAIVFALGLVAMVFCGVAEEADTAELGGAICEEEHSMKYLSYSTKHGLKCENTITKEQYDGIKIILEE